MCTLCIRDKPQSHLRLPYTTPPLSPDDVTECYKLLRRLVMDYLGLDNIVLPLTPSASSDFERSTASGFTMDKDVCMHEYSTVALIALVLSNTLIHTYNSIAFDTVSTSISNAVVSIAGSIE